MKIQNPHDKFFKETFGKVEVAKDFLNNYLPERIMNVINLNTIEPQKDSFINEELQEGFSDMLFQVDINQEEGYIYFLFEHKSYNSKDIALQLLKYMLEIWNVKVKKEQNALPVIIPLVIYHGSETWNSKGSLAGMIKGYIGLPQYLQRFIPEYEYLLYDLSEYTNEEIKGEAQLRIVLTIFRDIFTKSDEELKVSILKAAEYLQELEDRETGTEYFETLMRYIYHARDSFTVKDANEIIDKLETTYSEGSEVVMTLAEVLRKEVKEEVVRNAMNEGLELGLIAKLTGLSESEVKEIIDEIEN
ncbi:Rpn family recombination-promoting nuclease/putative transposase [Virgibacillus sp. NKC19-16]|uniref:Rpn family recombination-promoting nuclease/putative transposase n=1 Tax=Virgibacillus salidurans TaxID=2831673 RepID=UPI001F3D4B3F|nr:Rpn family recombination-promoting nuclease/putative transposase [Virgibacillus sp. NKC19-16]UJL45861.1 Rpn family recombination-promoting nuclease/putative transposase [Virgibacillus sp. NKC19-16]